MAVTIVPLLSDIHNCDAVSDWTGTPTLDLEVFIQGAGSLSKKVSKAVSTHMKPITSADLSDEIIYVWVLGGSIAQFDTKAGGGIRIRVEDASVNWGEWYIAGSDEGYEGGWQCLAVRTTATFDDESATPPSMGAITSVGVVFDVIASAAKINCWWDAMRYGSGLRIKAGTEGDPGTFADIVAAEETVANRWGIVVESEGVLMVQGQLIFGSTTGGEATYFKDSSKIIVFRDRAFGTFYEVKVEGNGTATTKVFLGAEAGGKGISGCVFNAAGSSKYKITATDTNITELGLCGCVFMDADTISLPAYSTLKKVLNCNFERCAEVLADTCTVRYCNFISADGRAVWMSSTSHNVQDCNFISCPVGVHIPNAGSYTFSNLIFSDCTNDVENSSSATQVDSYPDTNRDTAVQLYSGATTRTAQSFVATAGKLSRAILSLQKVGAPTGNVVAKLYADTGGSGPGTLLATSNNVDITDIGTSWAQVDLEFEDEFTLVATTVYWISVEYEGGDSSNRLEVGVDNSSPGHSGSCYTYTGSWGSQAYDMCFYANRDGIIVVNAADGADPSTATETASVKGATIIKNAVTLTVTCKNSSGLAVPGVRVRIETTGGTLITDGVTNASGIFTDSYNYAGDQAVSAIARLKGYAFNAASATITTSGLDVPFTMARDQAVDLP